MGPRSVGLTHSQVFVRDIQWRHAYTQYRPLAGPLHPYRYSYWAVVLSTINLCVMSGLSSSGSVVPLCLFCPSDFLVLLPFEFFLLFLSDEGGMLLLWLLSPIRWQSNVTIRSNKSIAIRIEGDNVLSASICTLMLLIFDSISMPLTFI